MTQVTKRVGYYGTWCGIAALGILCLAFLSWMGWASILELGRGRIYSGLISLGMLVFLLAVFLYETLRFLAALRAGMQLGRARRGDPILLLIRRIWFYGTWMRLCALALVVMAFVLGIIAAGMMLLYRGEFPGGACFLAGGLALLWICYGRSRKFFQDLRSGIQGELKRRNYCPHCEYDLRASETRCPECGQRIQGRSETIEV